jgi:chaperonin cofactor prefoldin
MIQYIKERVFPFLIALSALSVSASAAFYSVSGLSKLFAGASLAVIIMAGSLEVAKLVIASLLYQYRKTLPRLLKIYLTTAAFVLVLITSMGIYGFLSAAYQETANKAGNLDAQIALVETKRDNAQKQLNVYNAEKENSDKAIADLRKGLSNNVITYTNAQGQLITTTSSATRKALEKQLDQAIERQTTLNNKVDELNTQVFEFETELVDIKTNNDLAGELGPLKYLSGLTGIPMDQIVNILLLTIIFVFDPLAISLVIAANFAFEEIKTKNNMKLFSWLFKNKKQENNYFFQEEEIEDNEGTDVYSEEELKDWDNTLQDGLEDEEWEEEPISEPDQKEISKQALEELVRLGEIQEARQNMQAINRRAQKIKAKFNRGDEDLTIKY